ncbi:UDP-galactose/UDP-glucose transporter 2 [Platanthera guangdongensis]|uniref:UDP-galactose/UDP-glucose transporter 2 n=1 Tax=Platanthera guangdongensis TaxID=2320717 RepID=A0ABR2LQ13_9ASPA
MATFVGQVTTARKAVTLLLSYLLFTKPMTEQHGTGLILIAMGIVLKLLPEYKEKESIPPQKRKQRVNEEVGLKEKNDETTALV